jgi:hypothetical protein
MWVRGITNKNFAEVILTLRRIAENYFVRAAISSCKATSGMNAKKYEQQEIVVHSRSINLARQQSQFELVLFCGAASAP